MKTREHGRVPAITVESRYLEPNLVSLRFASLELYNLNPDFSNPRAQTLDFSKLPITRTNFGSRGTN